MKELVAWKKVKYDKVKRTQETYELTELYISQKLEPEKFTLDDHYSYVYRLLEE